MSARININFYFMVILVFLISFVHLLFARTLEIQHKESNVQKKLNDVPPEMRKEIDTLILSFNRLEEFPAEILNFTALKELDLGSNQLTTIPAEIGKLQSLETLTLCNNVLAKLPAEIGNLPLLKNLNLSFNKLTTLPAEIGKLQSLETLNLGSNRLAKLPAEIGKLSLLKKLDISFNKLTELPAEIGKLQLLEILHLTENRLAKLPAEIGKLSLLKKLDISFNKLTELPAEIGKLQLLEILHLTENRLAELPTEIGDLSSLRVINLLLNIQLKTLPKTFEKLTTVTELSLSLGNGLILPSSFTSTSDRGYINAFYTAPIPLAPSLIEKSSPLHEDNILEQSKSTKKENFVSIDQISQPLNIQEKRERMAQLDAIENKLLKKFVGWDDQIHQIMSYVKAIEITPDSINVPIVIPLISFPGYGKTTLIQEIISELGWQNRFKQYSLKKGTPYLNIDFLRDHGIKDDSRANGLQAVVFYDEIQHLVEFEKMDEKIEVVQSADGKPATVYKFSDNDRKAREESIYFLWDMLGNGVIHSDRSTSLDSYINTLEKIHQDLVALNEKSAQKKFTIQKETEALETLKKEKEKNDIILTEKTQQLLTLEQFKSEVEEIKTLINEVIDLYQFEKLTKLIKAYPSDTTFEFKKIGITYHELNKKTEAKEKLINDLNKELIEIDFQVFNFSKDANLIKSMKDIMINESQLLGKYKSIPLEQTIRSFIDDYDSFMDEIYNSRKKSSYDDIRYYKRMIIFIAGNPDKLINKIKKDFEVVDAENSIDPDVLYKHIEERVSKDALRVWFREIFGSHNSGLESRFQLDSWNLIPPFNSYQWHLLCQVKLAEREELFSKNAHDFNKNISIKFDQSVQAILYQEGLSPLQGPRNLITKEDKMFNTCIQKILSYSIDNNIDNTIFNISYLPGSKHDFLIATNGTHSLEISIGKARKADPLQIASDSSLQDQEYIQVAGNLIAGIFSFNSVPPSVDIDSFENLANIRNTWKEPAIELYHYKEKICLTYLGAYAAELIHNRDSNKRSIKASLFYPILKGVFEKIKRDIDLTRKSQSYGMTEKLPLSELMDPEFANDPFFQLIDQEKYDELINFLLKKAITLIAPHHTLISAFANELKKDKVLYKHKIKRLLKANSLVEVPKSFFTYLYESLTGTDTPIRYDDPYQVYQISRRPTGYIGLPSNRILLESYKTKLKRAVKIEPFLKIIQSFIEISTIGYEITKENEDKVNFEFILKRKNKKMRN